jgi:hypothetical protein
MNSTLYSGISGKWKLLAAFGFILMVVIASCDKYTFDPPSLDPNKVISFETDLIPFFQSKCVSCHGGSVPPNLSVDKAYSSLTTRGYISDDPENSPETSEIYTKLAEGHSSAVTELDLQILLQWIRQGAQNN